MRVIADMADWTPDNIAAIQRCADYDIGMREMRWAMGMLLAHQKEACRAGITLDDLGLRYALLRNSSFEQEKYRLTACSIGHCRAPRPRHAEYRDINYLRSSHLDHVRGQIAYHAAVARTIASGRCPVDQRPDGVMVDPVALAAIRLSHVTPDEVLRAMRLNQPVSTPGFVSVSPAPAPLEGLAPLALHGELQPGRLHVIRVGLGSEAHYYPPDPDRCRLVGQLVVKRTVWPEQMRRGIIGSRMADLVGVAGLPGDMVVRAVSTSGKDSVLRIAGDHTEVAMGD